MRKEWGGTVHYKDFYNFRTTSSAYISFTLSAYRLLTLHTLKYNIDEVNVPKTSAQTQSFHPTNITQPRTDTCAQTRRGLIHTNTYTNTHAHTSREGDDSFYLAKAACGVSKEAAGRATA